MGKSKQLKKKLESLKRVREKHKEKIEGYEGMNDTLTSSPRSLHPEIPDLGRR